MANSGEKTEKPTPQRLEKARREGRFATSREFVAAVQFLAFVGLLNTWTATWFADARETIRILIERAFHQEFGPVELLAALHLLFDRMLRPVLVSGFMVAAASFASHLMVTRFGFSFDRLSFDPKRLDPFKKIRELPKQGGPATVQALAMLVVFSALLYALLKEQATMLYFLPLSRPEAGVRQIAGSLADLLWKAVLLFGIFGAVDLFRQTRKFEKEMRMSKQEIREEMKQSEGDPQMKARIRRLRRDMRRRQMMSAIPTATAVIVNPTHFAVAIRYKHDEMATPVVVAKGKNYLALRIRQRAIESHVPLVENPPLAQALYKSVDVGQEIPPHLYRAVAEILAYVYRLMEMPKLLASGVHLRR